jgi:hypothetical protein
MIVHYIARPINGIALNGDEYLLDDNNNPKAFDTNASAYNFLRNMGYDIDSMDAENIRIIEIDLNENHIAVDLNSPINSTEVK